VHAPGSAHHRDALHARVPSASTAQHPDAQSAFALQRELQMCPTPGSAAHVVG
jgi:hypothetical protein